MLCRYFNGASCLAIGGGTIISTPRRSSHVGCLQGADGTANPIPGNRSHPGEFESAGDGHDSAPS